MGDRKLETVAKEVFLSIPPDVRTGVFIDVFTPCDWHHAARCMVDYAGILDDPREPFAPACDMPVICTTTVTEKTVVSDVRPLVGLPDDIIDWLVKDGLPSADLWESLRFDRTGDPSRRIARSLSVAELKRLISMSVSEIGIHQWRDGYRMRGMEERR